MEIEKQLHKSFENIGDWFLCCKLCIHSGEYKKTKAVFSASECKVKKVNGKLDFLLRQGKLHTLHEILCNGHFKPYTHQQYSLIKPNCDDWDDDDDDLSIVFV